MLRELKALPGGNGIELGLELQVRVCQRSEGAEYVTHPEEAACFAIKCSKQNHMDSI